jgi:hypothetical protein
MAGGKEKPAWGRSARGTRCRWTGSSPGLTMAPKRLWARAASGSWRGMPAATPNTVCLALRWCSGSRRRPPSSLARRARRRGVGGGAEDVRPHGRVGRVAPFGRAGLRRHPLDPARVGLRGVPVHVRHRRPSSGGEAPGLVSRKGISDQVLNTNSATLERGYVSGPSSRLRPDPGSPCYSPRHRRPLRPRAGWCPV